MRFYLIGFIIILLFTGNIYSQPYNDTFANTDAPYIQSYFCSPFIFIKDSPTGGKTTLYYNVVDPYYSWADLNSAELQLRDADFNLAAKIPLVSIKLFSEDNELIKTFFERAVLTIGSYSLDWDGTDENGNIVQDGAYYFLITTEDEHSNTAEYRADVIKNTIASKITTPAKNEELKNGIVDIIGTAVDFEDFAYFELDFAEGEITDEVDGIQWYPIPVCEDLRAPIYPENRSVLQVQNGKMAEWFTFELKDNVYTIRLRVVDRNGNILIYYHPVMVDNPIYVLNLELENEVFSPNGDGILDTLKARYNISEDGNVRIKIYDTDEVLVFEQEAGAKISRDNGNLIDYEFEFDGRDNEGQTLADGKYRLIVEAESGEGIVTAESKNFYINNANIAPGTIAEIISPDGTTDVSGDIGIKWTYRAKATGVWTKPANFKIRVSVTGTYHKYRLYFPVYGGPYYFNRVQEYAVEWDGKMFEGPFFFIDSQGKEITYDRAPTCDFSQLGVNQASGFDTVGETEGELKIFYQNVTESETITVSEEGYTFTAETDPLRFLNVDITDVIIENSFFQPEVYSELLRVGPYEYKGYTYDAKWGPKIKLWYYCNAPLTLWGTMPYAKQQEFTGVCYKDEQRFVLYNPDGEDVTEKTVKELLDIQEDVLDAKYEIEIIENSQNVDIYFESKGAASGTKHSTSFDNDKIKGISTKEENWSTFYDNTLLNGYYIGKDYIFPIDGSIDKQIVTIEYTPPSQDIEIDEWQIELLSRDVKIVSQSQNSFEVMLNEGYEPKRLVEITGNISSLNLKEYILRYISPTGDSRTIKENTRIDSLNPQVLGVWDITGIEEGDYRLVLTVINQDGTSMVRTRDITINESLSAQLDVMPEADSSFSPDYEKAEIALTISENAIVTINIKDIMSGEIISTIVDNQEYNLGMHKFEWDGRDSNGDIVSDGDYLVDVIVEDTEKDSSGNPLQIINLTKIVKVIYVNKPLELSLESSGTYITPDGNGINDTVAIIWSISENANVELSILDSASNKIAGTGSELMAEGEYNFIWNGKDMYNNYVLPGEYKIVITATAEDNILDIQRAEMIIKVLETVEDDDIGISSPVDNEVVNTTAGAIYSYKAVAYGYYYPPVPVNWEIRRQGRSYWWKYGHNGSCRVNVDVNRNSKWTGDKKDGYCTACAPNAYKYSVHWHSKTSHASYSVSYRGSGCYRLKVHVWADAFSHHWGDATLTVYGRVSRYDNWTRTINDGGTPILVSNEPVYVTRWLDRTHPNPLHNYYRHVSIAPYDGYRYTLTSDYYDYLQHSIRVSGYGRYAQGGFWVKSNYHIDWDSGVASPYIKEFNSVAFDISENVNRFTHNIYQDLGYETPQYVEITGWDVQLISDSSAVSIDPNDISPNGRIGSDGIFNVILDKTKERRFITIKGSLGSDAKSYSLKFTAGTNLSNCRWQTIYASSNIPEDDVLAKWDVTYLYGSYTILLSVAKNDDALVEKTYKLRFGSVVTRENGGIAYANRTATSPYVLAELGFPPYAIPETAEDVNPNTPELEVLVDILPQSADNIQTDSAEKRVVGPVYDFRPKGMKFDKPVTLKFKYGQLDLSALGITDESRFAIYHIKDDGSIEYLPGYIDKANKIITMQINQFSRYVLIYDETVVPKAEFVGLPAQINEDTVDIAGTAQKGCKIKLYLNNYYKGEVGVDDTGKFRFSKMKLNFGENKLKAVAINEHNIVSETNKTIIVYDNIAPQVIIEYNENNFEILNSMTNKNKLFFSPNNDGIKDIAKVKAGLNEDGKITFILNEVELKESYVKADEIIEYSWDGATKNEGIYNLIISGEDRAGNRGIDNRFTIVLDKTAPTILDFNLQWSNISPDGDSVRDFVGFSFKIKDNFCNEVFADIKVMNQDNVLIKTIADNERILTDYTYYEWDGKDKYNRKVMDGRYKIKIKLTDIAGNTSSYEKEVVVDTEKPADVGSIKLRDEYFSPNNDGIQDATGILYVLSEDSYVSISVYDNSDNLIRTIIEKELEGSGNHIQRWDGLDNSGQLVNDDYYLIKVTIIDKAGNRVEKSLPVTVDTIAPDCSISSPQNNENIEGIVDIRGTVYDDNFKDYTIHIVGDENFISTFTVPKINETLLLWDTGILNGLFNIRLDVTDLAGNKSSQTIQINLINDAQTQFLSVGLISKNLITQNQDSVIAYFILNKDANVDIVVKDENDVIIKTIFQNSEFEQGYHIIRWDGKDDVGDNVADGRYKIEFTANSFDNIVNNKYINVKVDRSPPQIVFTAPIENSFVGGIITIQASIIEPNLAEYVLEYGLGDNPRGFIFIESRRTLYPDNIIGIFDTRNLLNEKYKFRVKAIDIGGNEAIEEIILNIDNKPPTVEMMTPEQISGESFEITGTAYDENLFLSRLEYADISAPDEWWVISQNYESITNNNLGIWMIQNLSGDYILRLTAIDKASNKSVVSNFITINNQKPVIEISSPVENQLISKTVPIQGSVSDDDLRDFIIEYGEGLLPNKWDRINSFDYPVKNNTLAYWDTTGLNGIWTIRVSAFDISGNSSETNVTVNIDNTPPNINIVNPEYNSKNRSIVNVEWNSTDVYGIKKNILKYQEFNRINPAVKLYEGNNNSYSWDTSGLNGKYILIVYSEDNAGNIGKDEVFINIDNIPPVIENLSVNPAAFHPQSIKRVTTITFDLTEDAFISIDVLNSSGMIIRNLIKDYPYRAGSIAEIWDGLNNSGGLPPEGVYTIRVNGVDESGNYAEPNLVEVTISGDVLSPVISEVSASPDPFSPNNDNVKDEIFINYNLSDNTYMYINTSIKIFDFAENKVRTLIEDESRAVGAHQEIWDGKDDAGAVLPDGVYFYKIYATDGALNRTVLQGDEYKITLDNTKPEIEIINISENIISPNGDDLYDKSIITYRVSDNLSPDIPDMDIKLNDYDGNYIKTFYSNLGRDLDMTYTFEWYGDLTNSITNDGYYNIVMVGYDYAGNFDRKDILIGVDLTPPVSSISIGEPKFEEQDFILIGAATPITLSATDPVSNGVASGVEKEQYCIKQINDTTPIYETDWIDYIDGIINLYNPDGDYYFYYRGIDKVFNIEKTNQEQRKVLLRIDNTPPEVDILTPASYCWVNGRINIVGTATDLNFDWYKVEYVYNGQTNLIKAETYEEKRGELLAEWDTVGLTEGWYKVVVTAQDKLKNTTTIYLDLVVGTPEYISIIEGFNKPMYIAEDMDGNLYISDKNNKRVKRYNINGDFMTNIVENILQPQGIAVDTGGNIYLTAHKTLYKFDYNGNLIWQLDGFNQPSGIALYKPETMEYELIYVADKNNHRIVKVDDTGNLLVSIQSFKINGQIINFSKPADLSFDNKGNIYVVDSDLKKIIVFKPENNLPEASYLTDEYFEKPEGIDVSYPLGIAESDFPLIYVTDRNNEKIKCFDKYGNLLNSFGERGNNEGDFNKPEGILVTFSGTAGDYLPYLYIVDRNNNRVQKFGYNGGAYSVQQSETMISDNKPAYKGNISGSHERIRICNNIIDNKNKQVTINYTVDSTAYVNITVYNIIGEKIIELCNSIKPKGNYTISWDGKISIGEKVASGVYIMRLSIEGQLLKDFKVLIK